MTKARFIEEQPAVKYKEADGVYYIFICLNGKWLPQDEFYDESFVIWECDYNEIVTDDIDIDDVVANPKKYLDYVVKKVDPIEQLRADMDYALLLLED